MNSLNSPLADGPPVRVSPVPTDAVGIAIARSAHDVIGQHLDGVAEHPTQKKRNRQSNAQKIQSVFQRIDILSECNSLLLDTVKYLQSIENESCKHLVRPVIASIEYASETQASELNRLSQVVDNSSGLKSAWQAHLKLTKSLQIKVKQKATERKVIMTQKPKKALIQSMKDLKSFVDAASVNDSNRKIPDNTLDDVTIPRKKDGQIQRSTKYGFPGHPMGA